MNILFAIFSYFIYYSVSQIIDVVILDGYHLHEYNIQNKWEPIQQIFTRVPIRQIHMKNCIVSEEGFRKIFTYDLSNLKVFKMMTGNSVHPKAVKLLLQQQFIYNGLDILVLDFCNLSSEDFQVLQERQSKITQLSIKYNYVSLIGFSYISRLKMKLVLLELQGNSLLHEQSITSLISLNLSQIKYLNLRKTSISHTSLLQLLKNTNTSQIKSLDIRQNMFPLEFYQKFSKYQFQSLEFLGLSNLMIQDQTVEYFENLYFPALMELEFENNVLTNQGLKKLLIKSRFPKLQKMTLGYNYPNSSFIKHLQQQNFTIKELDIRTPTMDMKGLQQLTLMNLSKLQKLYYSRLVATPEIVSQFFGKANLANLKYLQMEQLYNSGNIFSEIIKANLQNLEQLHLSHIGDIGDIGTQISKSKTGLFPNLKKASLKIYDNNQSAQKKIIQNIHKIAPQLEELDFSLFRPHSLALQILFGSINITVLRPLTIFIKNYVKRSLFIQHENLLLKIIILPNSKIQIIQLNFVQISSEFIQTFSKRWDFSLIERLQQTSNYQFLNWHIKNKSCKFQEMKYLHIKNVTKQNLELLYQCQIPNLQYFKIDFQKKERIKELKLQKFPYLNDLTPISISKQGLLNIFIKNKLEYLKSLSLYGFSLEPQNIKSIMEEIPYLQKIRTLNLGGNFLNKDLTFLRQKKLLLKEFYLKDILLNQNVSSELCSINYEFMTLVNFEKLGLKDKDILSLIECLSNKKKLIFPKLGQIYFNENYLQTKGISMFMSLELPLILVVSFIKNKDPQFFNSIFRYASSKRLKANYIQNYISGIEKDLPKSHTKRLQSLKLNDKSIRSADIQEISKFQFDSLYQFFADFSKINDCVSLKYLHKIIMHATEIQIRFNQAVGISSSCFDDIGSQQSKPQIISVKINTPYGQARKFIEQFFNFGQELTTLALQNIYISDEKLYSIAKIANFEKLGALTLRYNDLSDSSIQTFLNHSYPMLKTLDLSGNQKITGKSLQYMNFTYINLQILSLADTMIGDEGISYLVNNYFPNLQFLSLKNSQISRNGLIQLSRLRAPQLHSLDLSCNQLSVQDIGVFKISNFPQLLNLIIYPTLSDKQLEKLSENISMQIVQSGLRKSIRIFTDIWYENYLQQMQ